jgi:thioesterase domain-containing protein
VRAAAGANGHDSTVDEGENDGLWTRNLEAVERAYQPREYSGRVMLYTTSDGARYTGHATLGWDKYVTGPLDIRRVPGDHVSMLYQPHIDVLASAIDADVRAAQVSRGTGSPAEARRSG